MIRALHDVGIEEKILIRFAEALWDVADHMRNRAEA
jgi:hemoglobin